jgi:hypothetical protein
MFEGLLKINIMRKIYKHKIVYIDLTSKELFRFISTNFTLNGNKTKEENNKKSETISKSTTTIIITVVSLITSTTVLIITIRYVRKIKIIENVNQKIEKYRTEKIKDEMIKKLIEKNILIERKFLNLKEILGNGNFGVVYKALLIKKNETIEVAVKTLKSGK